MSGRLAGWAAIPLFVAMISLITALFGMYWDIALHIGVGRDEGPLANPAHYPILIGLFGLSAAGALACALPRGDQAAQAAYSSRRPGEPPSEVCSSWAPARTRCSASPSMTCGIASSART